MNAKRQVRIALYVRVSTDGQTVANQERELREVAEAKDCEVVEVYRDSGTTRRQRRNRITASGESRPVAGARLAPRGHHATRA